MLEPEKFLGKCVGKWQGTVKTWFASLCNVIGRRKWMGRDNGLESTLTASRGAMSPTIGHYLLLK